MFVDRCHGPGGQWHVASPHEEATHVKKNHQPTRSWFVRIGGGRVQHFQASRYMSPALLLRSARLSCTNSSRTSVNLAVRFRRPLSVTSNRYYCALHSAVMNGGAQVKTEGHVKISTDVRPTHYAVTIRTDLDTLTFEGRAEIDLDINTETSNITFHATEPLSVTQAFVSSSALKTNTLQEASSIHVDKDLERVTAKFEQNLQAGTRAKLGVSWKGILDSSMMGYYKSSFEYEGRSGFYALTQFEACAARKAFPSWDEPSIKATFDISMISRSDTVSVSNMDIISTTLCSGEFPSSPMFPSTGGATEKGPQGEWTLTKFATSPKMSTYLVAWANGEFRHVESSYISPLTGRKVPMRVYTTPEHISQAQYALDVKTKVLPVYEKVFDIAYPLPKLDTLVASDFDAGAMENWGLITGRTSVYLYDEEKSGIASKKDTFSTQSHEVAHQWFGNIVTMEWWDNLWLNEAFATLMGEVIIVEKIHPEWRERSEFINHHLRRALNLDSLRSSHAIEVACPDEKAIAQIFDAISYSKGASVLRMLAYMLGEEVFLKGVSKYLKSHLYGNSVTADLWQGISEASGIDVDLIMKNWTLKVGFPVISVTDSAEGLHVSQHRFLSTGDLKPEEDETLWYVPLNVKTSGSNGDVKVDKDVVLAARDMTLAIPNLDKLLYKLNAETSGVYRVKYTSEHLARLGNEAAKGNGFLSADDRIGLVQDAIVLAKSGHSTTEEALDLIARLDNEEDYLVWSEIAAALSEIAGAFWEQAEARDGVNSLRRSLFGPLARRLGFDFNPNDGPDVIQFRVNAITSAAAGEDPSTLQEIKRRFALLLEKNDSSAISGNLQRCIYHFAVRHGGHDEYQKVLQIYRKPETPSQKTAAMLALCRTTDRSLIQRTFDLILSSEVKEQDYMYFFAGLSGNLASRRDTWTFMKENFNILAEKFKGNFSLGSLVRFSFDSLSTHEDVEAVEAFFKNKDTSTFRQPLSQGLDSVRARATWLQRDRERVESWLTKHNHM